MIPLHDTDRGKCFRLCFLDHAENKAEPMECEIEGLLLGFDETALQLRTWRVKGDDNPDNQTDYAFVRAAITAIGAMAVAEWRHDRPGGDGKESPCHNPT